MGKMHIMPICEAAVSWLSTQLRQVAKQRLVNSLDGQRDKSLIISLASLTNG